MLSQFVDDVLDFTGSSSLLGKPALNDLASGITTAPVWISRHRFPPPTRIAEPAGDSLAVQRDIMTKHRLHHRQFNRLAVD